jgi:hypothetical protein
MNSEESQAEIAAEEWLQHLRRISRRINGIIGHVVPEHRNPLRAKGEGWTYKEGQRTAWAMCRIKHESVGWCRMVVSFWGSHSVEVYVNIPFGGQTHRGHVHWGVRHSYGNLDRVEMMFSKASEYHKQVDRIVKMMLPLQPLFERDKLKWMIGEMELEKLERAAGKPARRKGKAKA